MRNCQSNGTRFSSDASRLHDQSRLPQIGFPQAKDRVAGRATVCWCANADHLAVVCIDVPALVSVDVVPTTPHKPGLKQCIFGDPRHCSFGPVPPCTRMKEPGLVENATGPRSLLVLNRCAAS